VDRDDPPGVPFDQNDRSRVRVIERRRKQGGAPVGKRRVEAPAAIGGLVPAEVGLALRSSLQTRARDQVDPDVGREQVAQRVELACVEQIRIGPQSQSFGFAGRRGRRHGRIRRERLSAAMQRSLCCGDRGAKDLRRLDRRVPKYVDQDDTGPLRDWERQESAKARCDRYASLGVGLPVGYLEVGVQRHAVSPRPCADGVDGGVVRNPEQPALRLQSVVRPSARRAGQRLLYDVLTVERRAHHASAIAVQSRPHRPRELLEVATHASRLPAFASDDDAGMQKDSRRRILFLRVVVLVGRSAIAASSSRRATCNV
jgi:hypothetical protein